MTVHNDDDGERARVCVYMCSRERSIVHGGICARRVDVVACVSVLSRKCFDIPRVRSHIVGARPAPAKHVYVVNKRKPEDARVRVRCTFGFSEYFLRSAFALAYKRRRRLAQMCGTSAGCFYCQLRV